MKEERKTESDRIAFVIHFATGCGITTHETTSDERNMEHPMELTIWNPNGVNGAHSNDAPVILEQFDDLFANVSASQRPNPEKIDVQIGSSCPP